MIKKLLYIIIVVGFFLSCTTTNKIINPNNLPEEESAALFVNSLIFVHKINGNNFNDSIGRKRGVYLPYGMTSITTQYYQASGRADVNVNLEKNNSYILSARINEYGLGLLYVSYHINLYDGKNYGKEIPDPTANLTAILSFSRLVLDPISDSRKETIKLENNDYILILKPDLLYSFTSKKTKETIEGIFKFIIEPGNNIATLQLDEANKTYILVSCMSLGQRQPAFGVTFRYEDSDNIQGRNISFGGTIVQSQ